MSSDPVDPVDPVPAEPALRAVVEEVRTRSADVSPSALDLGGGTGRTAVALALEGAHVTVVDRSADALATLTRRADEAGVGGRVVGVQADVETAATGDLSAFDIVVVHDVLDSLDDPAAVLTQVVRRLAPGGLISVVVAHPAAAVIGPALAGQPGTARRRLAALRADPPFDVTAVDAVLTAAGLQTVARRGLAVFAARVPGGLLDRTPGARADLAALDEAVADDPAFLALAGRVQVLARRPGR